MARHTRRLIVWTTGVLLSLAVLAILGIALLIWGVNPDRYRGRIEKAATDSLGRRVELTGALRWRPGLNFEIESLGGRIANAEGFGPLPLASWQALRLGVALRPLLDHRLVVDRIEMQGLRLNLTRNTQGVNWRLPPSEPRDSGQGLQIAVGRVALRDGAVTFTDESRGRAWSMTQLFLDVDLPAQLDAPMLRFSGVSLRARLSGPPLQPEGVALQVTLPRVDIDRASARVVLPAWQIRWNDSNFSGALDARTGASPSAEGSLQVQTPSLRGLMHTFSVKAPATRDASALGPMELHTRFSVSGGAAAVDPLALKLDSTRLEGKVSLSSLSPPALRFDLVADQVEGDRYLPPEDEPGAPLELPLAKLKALDAKGTLSIRRASLAGAAAREMRIDVD